MKSLALSGNYGPVVVVVVSRLRSPTNAWLTAKAAENRIYVHVRRRQLCDAQDLGAVAGVYAALMDAAKPGRVDPLADMMRIHTRVGCHHTLPPTPRLKAARRVRLRPEHEKGRGVATPARSFLGRRKQARPARWAGKVIRPSSTSRTRRGAASFRSASRLPSSARCTRRSGRHRTRRRRSRTCDPCRAPGELHAASRTRSGSS